METENDSWVGALPRSIIVIATIIMIVMMIIMIVGVNSEGESVAFIFPARSGIPRTLMN